MHARFLITLVSVLLCNPSWAQAPLSTVPHIQWGASAGLNHYKEPDFMQLRGPEVGGHVRTTNWARLPTAELEADLLLGQQAYTSANSGSMNGVTNLETRWRALVPLVKDEPSGEAGLAGLALHTLWNDLRGTTTFQGNTYGGYERSALQLWLPVRWRSGGTWEVDAGWLVYGRHTSKLSEVGPSYSDAINTQRRGQYVQLSTHVALTNGDAIKPFIRYTHLGDSNTTLVRGPQSKCPGGWCATTEPMSHRWQMGAIWEFTAP